MAYLEQTVTALSQVPAQIIAFAAARGWTTGAATLTRPGGGVTWTLATGSEGVEFEFIRVFGAAFEDGAAADRRSAVTCLPRIRGVAGNPDLLNPTKVHLFGNDAPYNEPDTEPYICCVIECGFNYYRHIYIGSIVKLGAYTGGDVIAMNYARQWLGSGTSATRAWDTSYSHFLFSACNKSHFDDQFSSGPEAGSKGGALITHPDNPVPWRQFLGPFISTGSIERLEGTEVFGGHRDGPNDGLVFRGFNTFAGANILTPVNLYAANGDDDQDFRIRPLGAVAGVRLVSMQSIEPSQQIVVGSVPWRVFPEFRKTTVLSYGKSDNGNGYFEDETSWLLGLAYRED